MMSNDGKLTLTVEEARQMLGISRSLIYDSIARGDIKTIRLGKRLLVPRKALDELLEGAGANI